MSDEKLNAQDGPNKQQDPPQNFAPRHGYPPPRMRFPPPNGVQTPGFPGGPPPHGFPPGGFPPMRGGFSPFRPPNFPPGPGGLPVRGNEPPPSFFNHPSAGQRVNGPPGMGGTPSRGPPNQMGRPPFPPQGFPGAPPGYRPPIGGMPPRGPGTQQMMQQNGQGNPQQPTSQTERLKKLAGISMDKELWIETKTGEGKAYFYHAETRDTVWERPDPSKAVVMSQEDLQKLVEQEKVQQQQQGHAGQPGFMPGFPATNVDDAWQEFSAPDRRKYYYNFLTRENTWVKPKALADKEAAAQENGGGPPADPVATAAAMAVAAGFTGMTMAPLAGVGYAGFRPSVATGGPQATLSGPTTAGQKDKSRPVSSTAVSGTPWCVVWTGDNRVFFFNPSTRTSVWERPPELYNRADVDVLVSKPPPEKTQKGSKAQKRQKEESEDEDDIEGEGEEEVQDSDTSNSAQEEENVHTKPAKKKTRQEKKAEKEKQKQQQQDQEKQQQQKQAKQPLPIQQEKPIDPAIQAELEAKRKRELIPLEERIKQFRQLLEDKKVSATSSWEKELSKIVFDQRYLLLGADERKASFEAYCRERSEIEKEEKKKRAKEAKDGFIKLMEEAKLHGKSAFTSFSTKWAKDARFKAVEKNRDRESYFKDFVEEIYKKEKEEKKKEREKAKEEFTSLLAGLTDLRKNSIWAIVKKRLQDEPQFKNKHLDSETRQKLFEEHVKNCPESTEEEEEEARRMANEALEAASQSKSIDDGEKEKEKERKKKKRDKEKEKEKEKPEKSAEEKALEFRKRQVEEELGEHLKERNREHERHKMQEHEQNFKALLTDLIKSTDVSWHDARKQLKKDARYENCELLEKDIKERLFRDHLRDLERKKRDKFFQFLDEHQDITFSTKWNVCKKIVLEDERFGKLKMEERKMEHEYRDWVDRRYHQALDDFEALLRETKIITYKSKQMITENEQHLRDILAVLEHDKRYLVLKDCPNERERILEDYLETLDRKGPPPPPTRNEDPERRRK